MDLYARKVPQKAVKTGDLSKVKPQKTIKGKMIKKKPSKGKASSVQEWQTFASGWAVAIITRGAGDTKAGAKYKVWHSPCGKSFRTRKEATKKGFKED